MSPIVNFQQIELRVGGAQVAGSTQVAALLQTAQFELDALGTRYTVTPPLEGMHIQTL